MIGVDIVQPRLNGNCLIWRDQQYDTAVMDCFADSSIACSRSDIHKALRALRSFSDSILLEALAVVARPTRRYQSARALGALMHQNKLLPEAPRLAGLANDDFLPEAP